MKNAKKSDFINHLVKTVPTITKSQAEQSYKAMCDYIVLTVQDEGKVKIPHLGTFNVVVRKATTYRNPQTQELIKKPPQKRVKFTMSETMKGALNQS